MGSSESKPKKSKIEPPRVVPSIRQTEQRQQMSSETMRIYGLDKESRDATPETFRNINSTASLTVKMYKKKMKDETLDEKKAASCLSLMARSIIERVTQNKYNKNHLKCVVLACFILVVSKLQEIDDAVVVDRMGDGCSVDRIREMIEDIKTRRFDKDGCYILQ